MLRSRPVFTLVAAFLTALTARPQVPPQVVQALKPIVTKLAEKVLKPKMQVDTFTLGGFKATQVEPDGDATAEKFSGSALFDLPKPLGPRKLLFKGLALKGATAEGALEETLTGFSAEHQGWTYHLTKLVLSDKGSRLEGTATLAGLKLDVGPLTLAPQGLQGTLTPGDLPLAEGPFTATLLAGEVTFSTQGVRLKGSLEVVIEAPVRHGSTGGEPHFEAGTVTFDSALLTGTGSVAPNLATSVPLLHKGQAWLVQKLAFSFDQGTPTLAGPTQLQFPLNAFCRAGATDRPYLSEALTCAMRGRTPAPTSPAPSSTRPTLAARRLAPAVARPLTGTTPAGWEGFSGTFHLPAASLHPSGLTRYRLDIEKGTAKVTKGLIEATGTRITGRLSWGAGFTQQTTFQDAPASLADGLYAAGTPLKLPAEVGAYRVDASTTPVLCDFSPSHSPEGLPESWMGVYLPAYQLSLPIELYTPGTGAERYPLRIAAKAGRFEGNGTFSGSVGVTRTDKITLHILPIYMEPFELHFTEGALLQGPVVKGQTDLTAKPLLDPFKAPITFRLTQNGVEHIEIITQTADGTAASETLLVGISVVLDAARLNPTNMDFSGRFDFHIAGAALPSVSFDHLILDASGGGIDGVPGPLVLEFKGTRWSAVPDQPHVNLWGFPLGLGESGYGVLTDRRFYVGLGGDMEINPILPSMYNRLLFTTATKGDKDIGVVELESPYKVDQSVASLASFDASLGFQVITGDDLVSDAYFLGDGHVRAGVGDGAFQIDAGLRFGRHYQGSSYFPYFYALGHGQVPAAGIPVAPNLEVYGLVGGLAHNFLPDEIRATTDIKGKPDESLGIALIAGVDAGTSDKYTFHGGLDLYVSQNLTTLLQGKGWLFSGRGEEPPDNQVSADLRFTRNPNTFQATLAAELSLYQGLLRPSGQVELLFAPDRQFIHYGTRETPISIRVKNSFEGSGYLTTDFQGTAFKLGAGIALSYSKDGDFGIIWGNAWLNARGDLIIELDENKNASFLGTIAAEGGASFGMKFETFWKDYKITIFSGSIATNLAVQIPGDPTFSGVVSIHYSVLGGAFSGSVSAHLDL